MSWNRVLRNPRLVGLPALNCSDRVVLAELEWIERRGARKVSVGDVAEAIGLPRSTVGRSFASLQRLDLVKKIPGGWKVSPAYRKAIGAGLTNHTPEELASMPYDEFLRSEFWHLDDLETLCADCHRGEHS